MNPCTSTARSVIIRVLGRHLGAGLRGPRLPRPPRRDRILFRRRGSRAWRRPFTSGTFRGAQPRTTLISLSRSMLPSYRLGSPRIGRPADPVVSASSRWRTISCRMRWTLSRMSRWVGGCSPLTKPVRGSHADHVDRWQMIHAERRLKRGREHRPRLHSPTDRTETKW